MTTDNNKNSQRNIRYTIRLNEEENALIRHDALTVKNYSNKAVARYIRDELLSSVSKADNKPSVLIPAANKELVDELRGAVSNLNQLTKVLHQLTKSSTHDNQVQHVTEMMKTVMDVSQRCKRLYDFNSGKGKRNDLANLALRTFTLKELKDIASLKSQIEAKQ